MDRYEVVVGNLGHAYSGNNPVEARRVYGEYKRQSVDGYGRVAGEPVALLENGDIRCEHGGDADGGAKEPRP